MMSLGTYNGDSDEDTIDLWLRPQLNRTHLAPYRKAEFLMVKKGHLKLVNFLIFSLFLIKNKICVHC